MARGQGLVTSNNATTDVARLRTNKAEPSIKVFAKLVGLEISTEELREDSIGVITFTPSREGFVQVAVDATFIHKLLG